MSIEPDDLLEGEEQPVEPEGRVRIVYTGPVAPHWDIQGVEGDEATIDEFRYRAIARLQLLPPHDPQFRRNRERVNRDAERERFELTWDLGYDEGVGDATALGDKPIGEAVGFEPAETTTPEVAAAEVAEEDDAAAAGVAIAEEAADAEGETRGTAEGETDAAAEEAAASEDTASEDTEE